MAKGQYISYNFIIPSYTKFYLNIVANHANVDIDKDIEFVMPYWQFEYCQE